jgi:kumamolisin
MTDTHVVLSGSNRPRKQDAERVKDVDPASPVEVTVTVRGPDLPQVTPGKSMSREQLERSYSASPADMDAVASELGQYGLEVVDSAPSTRSLRVRGTAGQMDTAFRADLGIYRHDDHEFRGREGSLQIPASLEGIVTGVFGLDQRRVARRVPGIPPTQASAESVAQDALSPSDLEERYRFPEGEGEGQTVAIAEFGGAYFPGDLATFCSQQGRPEPTVRQVGLGVPVLTEQQVMALPPAQREQVLGEAGEVNMDVQIVAGLCPAAEIIVYFATWDQKGWVDLLNEVVKGVPAGAVSVSVSWGLSEDSADFSAAAWSR